MMNLQTMERQNIQHHRVMQNKYKAKYNRLKREIKNLVFENAALADEVAQIQGDLFTAREERRFLVKRLLKHEAALEHLDDEQQDEAAVEDTINSVKSAPKKRGPKKKLPQGSSGQGQGQAQGSSSGKSAEKQRTKKPHDKIVLDAKGKPMLPIILNTVLIHSIGQILPTNRNFQSVNYIYPVGYLATRVFVHPREIQRKCVYTCKILNNSGKPQFQLIPDNDLDSVFFGDSANICHQLLLESIQHTLGEATALKINLKVQGEKFFGLTEETVRCLLRMDANYKNCIVFKDFDQPITASVADDDKDPAINAEVLQALVVSASAVSFRVMPEIKDEPPDELLDIIDYCKQ